MELLELLPYFPWPVLQAMRSQATRASAGGRNLAKRNPKLLFVGSDTQMRSSACAVAATATQGLCCKLPAPPSCTRVYREPLGGSLDKQRLGGRHCSANDCGFPQGKPVTWGSCDWLLSMGSDLMCSDLMRFGSCLCLSESSRQSLA